MAKCAVYTCDICGDHYEGGQFETTYFRGDSYTSRILIYDYGTYSKDTLGDSKHYDICPCCMTRVRNYINNLIEEEKCKVVLCPCEAGSVNRKRWRR